VLDCDSTLWERVCGEDGAREIEVTAPYRALQEFMIARMNAGHAALPVQKNNERDVLDVFDQPSDMPLKREHLVSWRINMEQQIGKHQVASRKDSTSVGSFIFVDDNPVECADVRINCPGVSRCNAARRRLVAFVPGPCLGVRSSALDRGRSRPHPDVSRERREAPVREESFSLKDFVRGLRLRLEFAEPTEDQLDRVSQ